MRGGQVGSQLRRRTSTTAMRPSNVRPAGEGRETAVDVDDLQVHTRDPLQVDVSRCHSNAGVVLTVESYRDELKKIETVARVWIHRANLHKQRRPATVQTSNPINQTAKHNKGVQRDDHRRPEGSFTWSQEVASWQPPSLGSLQYSPDDEEEPTTNVERRERCERRAAHPKNVPRRGGLSASFLMLRAAAYLLPKSPPRRRDCPRARDGAWPARWHSPSFL